MKKDFGDTDQQNTCANHHLPHQPQESQCHNCQQNNAKEENKDTTHTAVYRVLFPLATTSGHVAGHITRGNLIAS